MRLLPAEVLDRLILDYSQRLAYVADKGDFANIQSDGEQRRAIYEWMYHEVNILPMPSALLIWILPW